MTPELGHIDLAEDNERFADLIRTHLCNDDFDVDNQNDWIVTARFYSLLHYVEKRLQDYGYSSRSHGGRKENILECPYIDNKVRRLYRRLEDVSRDARYECIPTSDEDVTKSESTLQEGKDVLGFSRSSSGHKYST